MDVVEYDPHRFLEVADRIRHDLIGRQPRRRYLAQETPDDPLIVALYSLVSVDQPANCVPVEDIGLLCDGRLSEGWVVPIRRANIKTLLEVVLGGGVVAMEIQDDFIAPRSGLRCRRTTVVPLKFVAHTVELVHLEPPLKCIEQ